MSWSAVSSEGQRKLGPVVVTRMELPPPPYERAMGAISLVMIGLAISGFGVFMVVNTFNRPVMPGMIVSALGLPLLALGGFFLARHAALRCGFTLHERGIVISRKDTDSVIPFSDVQDFSLTDEEVLSNGRFAGIVRLMDFTWGGGKTQISQRTKANTEDTFGPVVKQLLRKLADAAEARLEAGHVLRGPGWTLDSQGLSVGQQGAVRLSELARVGTFDHKVSFWREGEERPFFSIAVDSPNAQQLRLLARRRLRSQAQRQDPEHAQPMAGGPEREQPMAGGSEHQQPTLGSLGRVLFQRKPSEGTQVLCWFLAATAFMIGTGMAIKLASKLGFSVMGVLWGVAAVLVYLSLAEFRVYELGVSQRKFRWRTLRYSELSSFQFGVVRNYQNGIAYVGTTVAMRFTPGPGGKALTYVQVTRGNDADLEMLRDQVAGIVATQLFERFERGEDIPWGPTAHFTQKGLVIRVPKKLFKAGEERLVPYGAGLRYQIARGGFLLFMGQDTQAVLALPCAADNFYPGLKLLEALCSHVVEAPRASA